MELKFIKIILLPKSYWVFLYRRFLTKPTISALEFFLPKLVIGGVIIFDDYGSIGHPDTKIEIDQFFSDKSGILMKSPTGQAIYFNNIS